jgi:uncharacterized repeat protein (TIGR01451 family)
MQRRTLAKGRRFTYLTRRKPVERLNQHNRMLRTTRVALAVLALALALVLILSIAVVARQSPDFSASYKTGPRYARKNETITYTVVTVNTGAPVLHVVLSDAVPITATYIPSSCTFRRQGGSPEGCVRQDWMWEEDFPRGDLITTTFAVWVTADTAQWPLENCAYLNWDDEQLELCYTTIVNPPSLYVPIVANNSLAVNSFRSRR